MHSIQVAGEKGREFVLGGKSNRKALQVPLLVFYTPAMRDNAVVATVLVLPVRARDRNVLATGPDAHRGTGRRLFQHLGRHLCTGPSAATTTTRQRGQWVLVASSVQHHHLLAAAVHLLLLRLSSVAVFGLLVVLERRMEPIKETEQEGNGQGMRIHYSQRQEWGEQERWGDFLSFVYKHKLELRVIPGPIHSTKIQDGVTGRK